MTLRSTKTHLIQLLEDKENKVVALSGKWGTGKSHLWRAVRDTSQDDTVKKALYVSLFGLNNMTQVKLKIIQSALPNADEHSAAWDKLRETFKTVQKVLKSVHSGFSALDDLALLAVPTILKDKVIVLDDIERKHEKLNIDEVLGFIDEFTQLHKARFVLILNSDQLNDKTVWDRLREKVIDQEIRLDTTASEAFEIAISLTPSNFGVHIQKTVETCGVTNIRIIRKVINAVNRILGERQHLSEQILNRVIPSIVLLAAIHYKGIEDGPDFEFVLKTGSTEDWRDWGTQKEDLDEDGKRRAKWKLFLRQLGIIESDEFELLVVEYLQSGLFDSAAVSKIIDRYAAEASTMRAQEMARQLRLHVVWHHNLTESELLAEARALANEVHLLDAYNVTSLHDLVSDLSGGQAVADLLLNNWTTVFKAQSSKDYDSENFFSRKLHPLIKKEFDAIKATVQTETTIFEACEQIVQNNGWGQRQEIVLRAATVKDFEEAIKSLEADKLRLFMCKFLELCVHHENYVSNFGTAMKHFIEACKNIYSDPNTGRLPQLIQTLFKDAKLSPQLDPKLVKATPAPAVDATT